MKKVSCFIISILLLSNALHAEIKLPSIVSNGMVLQRNQPLLIWGWADNQESISVNFRDKIYKTKAGKDQKWFVKIDAQQAGGPYQMVIAGKSNKIELSDLLIGDVWLCSGQSNMEAQMSRANIKANYPNVIATSNYKNIRQFAVQRDMAFSALEDVKSEKGWVSVNPKSILSFSAVAFFFARDLYEKYNIPIGIINSSVGGTPIQSWVDYGSLKHFPAYQEIAKKFQHNNVFTQTLNEHRERTELWYKSVIDDDLGLKEKWYQESYTPQNDWKEIKNLTQYNAESKILKYGTVWFKTEIDVPAELIEKQAKLFLGMMLTQDETYINGYKIGSINSGYTDRDYIVNPGLFKAGKNTITIRLKSPTTGISFNPKNNYKLLFDQDSVSLNKVWEYRIGVEKDLLPRGNGLSLHSPTTYYYSMIKPLANYAIKGVLWYQGESNVPKPEEYQELLTSLIGVWRKDWSQSNLPFLYVQLPNYSATGKEPEVSNWALLREAQLKILQIPNTGMVVTHDIGEKDELHPKNKLDVGKRLALVAEKIAYHDDLVYSGPIYKSITISNNQIYISFDHIGSGLKVKGDKLNGFTVSADGKNFVPAEAKIVGIQVEVWSNNIEKPIAVRYAWADSPDDANLYNAEGLPASGFKSN